MQFGFVAGKFGVVRIRRNRNQFAEAHQDAGKRLRDDQAVPGVEHPRLLNGDVKHGQRNAGRSRQGNRAGLHFVARAARAVEGEGDCPALLQGAAQAEQGAHGVAAAGAFDGDESEFADDASHVFAVVAVAAHHADSDVAEKIRGGDYAGVPERNDQRPLAYGFLCAFFARDADAQRGADEADESVSGGDDDAKDNSLAQGEAAGIGSHVACGWAFVDGGLRHDGYCNGRISGRSARVARGCSAAGLSHMFLSSCSVGLAFQVGVDPLFDSVAALVGGIEVDSERLALPPGHNAADTDARQSEQGE